MGNPGKRPLNAAEPVPDAPVYCPDPPEWLGVYGKREWRRVAPYLHKNGLLTDPDITPLAVYCQSIEQYVEASKLLAKDGPIVDNGKGQLVRNPASAVVTAAATTIARFVGEFGFTPSSRARIQLPGQEDDDDMSWLLN